MKEILFPDPSVKRISLVWATSLSMFFLFGWLVGYFFAPDSSTGSDIGSIIGLSFGGAISGLGTALEFRAKYPAIKTVHVIIICIGWALALFIIVNLQVELGRAFD